MVSQLKHCKSETTGQFVFLLFPSCWSCYKNLLHFRLFLFSLSFCIDHERDLNLLRYHIPRTWLHAGENLLVLHEEVGGDPSKISVLTRTGEEICGIISQSDHPPPDTWKPKVGFKSVVPQVRLSCDEGWHIASVSFASYGTPKGNCGAFIPGSCHLNVSTVVQKVTITSS